MGRNNRKLSEVDAAKVKAERDKKKAADKFGSSVRGFFGLENDKHLKKPSR